MKKRWKWIFAGALFVALIWVTIDLLSNAGVFRTIEPHSPTPEKSIEGFEGGTEDFALRGSNLFVSSVDFMDNGKAGKIYRLDTVARTKTDITPTVDFSFRPHGLGLSKSGPERLYVVNHRDGSALPSSASEGSKPPTHTVEVFSVEADGLTWLKAIKSDLFTSPNDVVATDEDTLYITNDHRFGHGLLRTIEDYAALRLGTVVRCSVSTSQCEVVLKNTLYANGIEYADGRILVAETTANTLTSYAIDGNQLTQPTVIPCESGVDNIMIDPVDGSWWIGAHPQLLEFQKHAANNSHRSSSQVLRIDPKTHEVSEVYLNNGDPLSGSSVAVRIDGVVWMGAVLDPRVIYFTEQP